ncbi:hypothetical protein R3W88_006265 [Solanum pinnatisectum]|uniref:Uncharacterized protein n=1 Tax=Solanum pinnatisectum TaxID=50273 RepID=A0AAV9KF14_9SOLN|nr:hypothetical protein R3W88_006265 [Solanum pinnatisectum]
MEIEQTHYHNGKDSYAGTLGYRMGNRSKLKIRHPPRVHKIIDGKAVVVFTKEEHELLADTCRWTIIDKENGDMAIAEPSQVNLEEYDTSANQQNQVRISRWDKVQKEKEGKASKRYQQKLNVRSTRSENTASITNPEAELQGKMLSLVIKDPKDIKNIQNKRKKFTGEVSIPKEVTLQGEFRDDDGIVRKTKADQLTKWASLTNKTGTREGIISQGANWKREVNTETHGMYNKQEGGYNNNHEPPDKQHREPRERDEYEEVYHNVEVMETEFELTHTKEEG